MNNSKQTESRRKANGKANSKIAGTTKKAKGKQTECKQITNRKQTESKHKVNIKQTETVNRKRSRKQTKTQANRTQANESELNTRRKRSGKQEINTLVMVDLFIIRRNFSFSANADAICCRSFSFSCWSRSFEISASECASRTSTLSSSLFALIVDMCRWLLRGCS